MRQMTWVEASQGGPLGRTAHARSASAGGSVECQRTLRVRAIISRNAPGINDVFGHWRGRGERAGPAEVAQRGRWPQPIVIEQEGTERTEYPLTDRRTSQRVLPYVSGVSSVASCSRIQVRNRYSVYGTKMTA